MGEFDNKKESKASATDHLANERTFLAWIRTSIALMGFGFVIVKFAVFIRQISYMVGEKNVAPNKGYSAQIGVGMAIIGGLIAILAYLRYRNIEKQLNNNSYFPSMWLSIIVTLSILIGSFLLILYLLPSIA